MVFVEMKRTADFIAAYLSEHDFPTTSMHGDRLQREREEVLCDFKTGHMRVLVATAVAARGLGNSDKLLVNSWLYIEYMLHMHTLQEEHVFK